MLPAALWPGHRDDNVLGLGARHHLRTPPWNPKFKAMVECLEVQAAGMECSRKVALHKDVILITSPWY